MSKLDIPFNMEFSFGDDLREVPEDSEQMRKGLEWLQDKLVELGPEDSSKAALLLTQIAGYARIMGDYTLSEKCFLDSIRVFEEAGKTELVFANKLRMAVLYQHQKNYTKSSEIYTKSIHFIRNSKNSKVKNYLDFALQHYGKQKFEQKMFKEALDLFMEAYELRLAKGDLDLMSSTEIAINAAKEALEKSAEE